MELYWLTQTAAYWSLVIFLVPLRYIKKLFLYAFICGFIYTWAVQYIAVVTLGIWRFKPDIFTAWGIPVFFVLSWFAATLIYGFLLLKYPKSQLWVTTTFVLWTTVMNYAARTLNQIYLPGWGIPQTFMFAIFSHILLLYVLKWMHKVDELGCHENAIEYSFSILKNKRN